MRCNWRRWLWGLIPLVMLACVAVLVERGRIEQDLALRTQRALAASESGWARIEFEARDAKLSGRAVMDEQPVNAERAVRAVWGVRDVDNNAALPPKVEPFLWSARRRSGRVRLFGYVPNRATRRTIIGMANAALPGLDVSDRMSTARGVPSPDTWLAGLSFAMKQLALLKRGDVRMEDLTLSISGEAEDADAYRALTAGLKRDGAPKGITLGSVQVTPPVASPFLWTAQLAGGQVILSGHVPSEAARAEIVAAAKAGPRVTVIDRMELAEGAPQGWTGAAVAVVKDLLRLESGEGEIKDNAVTAIGIAADEAAAHSIRSALRAALPTAFKFTHQISVREPPPAPKSDPPRAQPPPAPPREALAPKPEAESWKPFPSLELEPPPSIPPATDLGPVTVKEPPPAPAEPRAASAQPEPQHKPAPPADPAPAQRSAAAPFPSLDLPKPPVPPPAPDLAPVAQPSPAPAAAPKPTPKIVEVPKADTPKAGEPKAEAPPSPVADAPAPAPPAKPDAGTPAKETVAAATPPAKPEPAEDACKRDLARVDLSGHILFDTDSTSLDAESRDLLDRLAAAAQSCNGLRIAIEGHTDTEGSARYNKNLSVRRARTVRNYLLKAGMKPPQLEAIGHGYARPVAPNDTPENMAKNRRIEFSIRR